MLRTRVIPVLLLKGESLVKTVKFGKYSYIGDPFNTVRIFNELEVDEIIVLDIEASRSNTEPNYEIISGFADECFMPLAYGGGIKNVFQAEKIFNIGIEKICLNSALLDNRSLLTDISRSFGVQSVIASVDVKKNLFGRYEVYSHVGKKRTGISPSDFTLELEELGAGEILLTSVDGDGMWTGYDLNLLRTVNSVINIPLIACGGASDTSDFEKAVKETGVAAVAAGSMFVFQGKDLGVLVNFPSKSVLEKVLN